MDLREFLFRENIKKIDFAREIKVSPKTLWGILKGKHDMRLSTALRIEKATKNQVAMKDLVPDLLKITSLS